MNLRRMNQRDPHPFTVALVQFEERARNDERFKAAIAYAQAQTDALCANNPSVEEMRRLGGFSKVITDAFRMHIGDASIVGSFLVPVYELRNALTAQDVANIRFKAQRHVPVNSTQEP